MKTTRIGLMAMLLTGALLAAPALVRAQDTGKDARPRPNRPARGEGLGAQQQLDRLAEELKLTEDQKKKVAEAQKARMEKLRQIREDSSLSQEQKREKFREAMQDFDKKMKEILTSEQYEKWQKMRPQGPAQGRGPLRGPRSGAEGKKSTDDTK
jgi:Spy/CpxP family protein refolding chaperone